MKAILSDIHGNLEALQAVLDDAAQHHAEEIYCLGDLVGYGPNPRECVDLAMRWKVCVMGNFDLSIQDQSFTMESWGVRAAAQSVLWSRTEINAPLPSLKAALRRRKFLEILPHWHREERLLFVHASPRNPLYDYIFPEDIYCTEKLADVFSRVERLCFVGHTHLPGIFTEDFQYQHPDDIGDIYRVETRKTLCNVGSVGQPRDEDVRASYVLFDADTIHFRRIEYDLELTVKKICSNPELDDWLGERLKEGR